MQKSSLYVALVLVGYLLLIGAVAYIVPRPWNVFIAVAVFAKAAGYLFAIRKASTLGSKRRPPEP